MHLSIRFSALALFVALASCGGSSSSDPRDLLSSAGRALGNQDYEAALKDFTAASEAVGDDTANPLYKSIQEGLLFAQAGADPQAALATLKARADDMGDNVEVDVYSSVASHMSNAGQFDAAAEVIAIATEKFGKNDTLKTQVASIMKKMAEAGDSASGALDAMAGLGYVGD